MIQRLGDGQCICSEHWSKEFTGPEPVTGWEAGKCDWCSRAKAAATLGRKGGMSKSEAKVKASRENGKKGGRPKRD